MGGDLDTCLPQQPTNLSKIIRLYKTLHPPAGGITHSSFFPGHTHKHNSTLIYFPFLNPYSLRSNNRANLCFPACCTYINSCFMLSLRSSSPYLHTVHYSAVQEHKTQVGTEQATSHTIHGATVSLTLFLPLSLSHRYLQFFSSSPLCVFLRYTTLSTLFSSLSFTLYRHKHKHVNKVHTYIHKGFWWHSASTLTIDKGVPLYVIFSHQPTLAPHYSNIYFSPRHTYFFITFYLSHFLVQGWSLLFRISTKR